MYGVHTTQVNVCYRTTTSTRVVGFCSAVFQFPRKCLLDLRRESGRIAGAARGQDRLTESSAS